MNRCRVSGETRALNVRRGRDNQGRAHDEVVLRSSQKRSRDEDAAVCEGPRPPPNASARDGVPPLTEGTQLEQVPVT